MVDYKKLLRDLIRGCFIDIDYVPLPIGGPISPDDEHDDLCDVPADEEMRAFAELLGEVKAEAIAAGESRVFVLRELDNTISECLQVD